MTRFPIRWDARRHQWMVLSGLTAIGAFDRLYQAERFAIVESKRRDEVA